MDVAVGYMWQVTGDRLEVKPETWHETTTNQHLTHNFFLFFKFQDLFFVYLAYFFQFFFSSFLLTVLLFSLIERFSFARRWDLKLLYKGPYEKSFLGSEDIRNLALVLPSASWSPDHWDHPKRPLLTSRNRWCKAPYSTPSTSSIYICLFFSFWDIVVTPSSSTAFPIKKNKNKWHLTCDTWHVKCDIWHVAHEMWEEVNLLSKFQRSSS